MRELHTKINELRLEKYFAKYLEEKNVIHPAKWYQDAKCWYKVCAAAGPYHMGTPDAEHILLIKNIDKLLAKINANKIVFWGVGNSEKEVELVKALGSKSKNLSILAIDCNLQFLHDFSRKIETKTKLNKVVLIRSLFEEIHRKDIISDKERANLLHVCLGNTVGNYNELREISGVFSNITQKGDFILIGFQTNRRLLEIFELYKNNNQISKWLINALPQKIKKSLKSRKLKWRINTEKSQVESWLHDMQVFRSMKFDPDKIEKLLFHDRSRLICTVCDDTSMCINAYEFVK